MNPKSRCVRLSVLAGGLAMVTRGGAPYVEVGARRAVWFGRSQQWALMLAHGPRIGFARDSIKAATWLLGGIS